MESVASAKCLDYENDDSSLWPSTYRAVEYTENASDYSSGEFSSEEPPIKTRKIECANHQELRLPEDLETFEFPVNCFPRYESALDNIGDIAIRYSNCFQTDVNKSTGERENKVHFCMQSGDASIRIEEIIHTTEGINITPTLIGRTKSLTQTDVKTISSSIVITRLKQKSLIQWALENCLAVVIIVAHKGEKEKASKNYKSRYNNRIIITYQTAAAEKICNLLEKFALSKFKTACEEIYGLIDSERSAIGASREQVPFEEMRKQPTETDKSTFYKQSKLSTSAIQSKTKTMHVVTETVLPAEYAGTRRQTLKGSIYDVQSLFTPYTLDMRNMKQIELSVKESLLEEMVALYTASNVPNTDWPKIPALTDRKVPKEISEQIYQTCPDVKGIGYRFDVLQLTVQENISKESGDDIRKLLKEMKIDAYEIVNMSIKEFSSVGAGIYVDTRLTAGSLGCFATSTATDDKRHCLLLSKHVAAVGKGEEGKDGKVFTTEGDRLLGHILQDTVNDKGYDIAATLLKVDVKTCDTGFRNSKGSKLKAIIDKQDLKGNLRGRKVHLWGAKSRPGRGIITTPYYSTDDTKMHHIIIEDVIDGEKRISQRFVEPGDSGAVACVDDPGQQFVYPLSMVVGLQNYKEVEEDNKKEPKTVRGQYLTLPLDEGLKDLEKRTKSTFDLMLD